MSYHRKRRSDESVSDGENRLKEKKKTSSFRRFIGQFADVMILILLAAAAVSFFLAFTGEDKTDFFEPILILVIVVVNAIIGVLQENKAEKALEALNELSAPLGARYPRRRRKAN